LVAKVKPNDPYVSQIRVGQFQPGIVRLVFDLKEPIKPQLFTLDPVGEYKYRMVFDLYPTTPPDPLMELVKNSARKESALAKSNEEIDLIAQFATKKEKEVVKEPPKPAKAAPPKEVPKKVEPPKKVEAPKPAALTPAQIKANAEADKRREANIASLRGLAANDGGTGGTVGSGVGGGGNAPPGWSDKVIKKVRANITFNADSFKGNKQTVIQLRLAPDGAILSRTMTSSSGDNAWDQAVLSAIDATQSLPRDDNGQFPTLTPELKLKPK
jgi:TolA protein